MEAAQMHLVRHHNLPKEETQMIACPNEDRSTASEGLQHHHSCVWRQSASFWLRTTFLPAIVSSCEQETDLQSRITTHPRQSSVTTGNCMNNKTVTKEEYDAAFWSLELIRLQRTLKLTGADNEVALWLLRGGDVPGRNSTPASYKCGRRSQYS
ncbi:hypothetical protein ACTFIV_005175 [Dictyostelium citrinum]